MRKRLIILVPGSKTKLSSLRILNELLGKFYRYFGVDTENSDAWIEELKTLLSAEEPSAEVIYFSWSGGVTRTFSLNKAGQELFALLSEKGSEEVILLCKSLGGVVGEIAARKYGKKLKLIEVATPHAPCKRAMPLVELITIYSPQDKYFKLANKVLYCGLGKNVMAHARNVALPNVDHSDFNKNIEVDYDHSQIRLFELYKKLIR